MTEYLFTGTSPRVLTGLSQGVNATLSAGFDRADPPYGATLEASFGDAIHTDEPYEHPELEEVAPEPQPTNADGTLIAPPAAPVVPIQIVAAPAPVADPAQETMTAEGAPAPAEPTN